MDCEFTEEVSLLVDGELAPHEAARLSAHVEGCADCRRAREAFLLLRRELRSYELVPDPHAQSSALAAILGPRTFEAQAAGRAQTPRGMFGRLTGSLAGAFGVSRLRPAHVAALALLLVGAVLGVRWFKSSSTPTVANTNSLPAPAQDLAKEGGKRSEQPAAVNSPPVRQAQTPKAPRPPGVAQPARENARLRRDDSRTGLQSREAPGRDAGQESARAFEPAPVPSPAGAVALYAAGGFEASAADPALRFGRHAERVERLFRSFRNARLTSGDPTLEVADARRLSKRLLYRNIALRREAASAGDLPVEGLLESVEPILIDISNLPDTPSPDAVGSIKERIHRRQLVGVLQAQAMPASRY
ncbi:MAG: zf-HC2 domain-containing protein [Acidobacteria bacterium]|nr:zf-HC2 domain-containing protein [Acidobacteriota bacterium]